MPLQATSGAASYDAFGGGVPAVPNYIEDVFSTYLYTGNGSTQTITNGVDLSTNGGLVWLKYRSGAAASIYHHLYDSARGKSGNASYNYIYSNESGPQGTGAYGPTSFNTNGFTLNDYLNESSIPYVSWTWRKQPKFFDVVTWTGTGSNRTISHNLGSVPACIMVKRTDNTGDWQVYHSSLANTEYLVLNTTAAKATGATRWNSTTPTSTVFSIGTDATVNASGGTYVAYIFASDAGGFGLTGTDNVISCGSFTADSSGYATVNLGYEPQFLITKVVSAEGYSWRLLDTMRGWSQLGNDRFLTPNSSSAEGGDGFGTPTATGFEYGQTGANTQHIYIAIRRGPMKVPTDATKVFSPQTATYSANQVVTTGFPVDMTLIKGRTITLGTIAYDRLRGLASTNTSPVDPQLITSDTSAETSGDYVNTANNTGYQISAGFSGFSSVNWNFKRAPSFFDVVCYTGTGSNRTVTHNLTVAPELIIVKRRDSAEIWPTWSSAMAYGSNNYLNYASAVASGNTDVLNYWDTVAVPPTSTTFAVGTHVRVNASGGTYVAYLFATCAGVSKCFNYTGNGSSQTINCGFTGGARWILIKRTDSTGDWYCWDSARGIVSGNDPHLSLNSTAAEVTTDDSVDTDSTGFIVNQLSATNINVSSATYIGIAIA